jgi:multiple sugar transport system substrate-binding protein
MKRVFAIRLLLILAILSLTACAAPAAPPPAAQEAPAESGAPAAGSRGTLRFIGPTGGAVKALTEDLIPMFEAETGIKVEATYVAHDALTQKAMTEFVSGTPTFDVIQFETSWGGRYSPFLEDLEPFIEVAGDAFAEDDILAAARNMGIADGKTVGLPYRVIGRILHYRTDIFEEVGVEPPQTFDEMREVAQAVTLDTDDDGEIDVYGFGFLGKQGYGNAYEFGTFLFGSGGAWWNLDTCEILFNDETAVQALQFYADLRNEYGVMPPEVTTWAWDEWIAGGQTGRYAMTIMHTPYAVPLNNPEASETAGLWGWADAPGRDTLDQGAPPVGGWLFGIPVAAEQKDMAWEFIQYMTGKEAQLKSAFNENAPTRRSVFEDADVQAMWPWADVALRSLERGTPMYNNSEELEAESALMVTVSEVLLGEKAPQQAADEAAEKLKDILAKSGRCPE